MHREKWIVVLIVICLAVLFCGFSIAENEKWGYIDKNGQVMVDMQYDYAYPFSNDRARVFKGTVSKTGVPDEGFYGFINRSGSLVIPAIYEHASDFNRFGLAAVSKNGKYGIINTDGKSIIDFTYDHITYSDANEVFFAHKGESDDLYCIIEPYGNEIKFVAYMPTVTDGCIIDFSLYNSFKGAIISLDGEHITDYIYDDLSNFSESIGWYKRDGKYGFIRANGKELTDAVFDEVGFFHNGKAIGYIDGQYCLIDSNGQIIKKYDVDHIRLNDALEYGDVVCAYNGIVNDRAPVMDGGEYFLMKSDGTILTRGYKHTITMDYDNTYFVPEDGIQYVLDQEGNEIAFPLECEEIRCFGKDRFLIRRGQEWALSDREGKLLTDFVIKDLGFADKESDIWCAVCSSMTSGKKDNSNSALLECHGELPEGYVFSGPKQIKVSLLIKNAGDGAFPGPVELYYPDHTQVEEFGSPVLEAGDEKYWEGDWQVTQEELDKGQLIFFVRYPVIDETSSEIVYKAKKLIFKIELVSSSD